MGQSYHQIENLSEIFCGEKLILYHILSETMQKKSKWSLSCVGKAVRKGFLY